MRPIPKPVTGRHPKYLEFVRTLPCRICMGPSEAHHAGDRGMGIKADDLTAIPLCPVHHREFHDKGRMTFEEKHNIDLWEVIARTLVKYVKEKELSITRH